MSIKSISYLGFTIDIVQDTDSINPRTDYDNTCKLITWHRNYELGDKNPFTSPDEAIKHFKATKAVYLPVYLYDHSGITINTTGFSCPWDSGQIGYIYAERDTILKTFNRKVLTNKLKEQIKDTMRSEIKTYDDYLTGNVYGYVIKNNADEIVDSCPGFFGDPDNDLIDEAKATARYEYKQLINKHLTQLKAWIKNKVNLNNRQAFSLA